MLQRVFSRNSQGNHRKSDIVLHAMFLKELLFISVCLRLNLTRILVAQKASLYFYYNLNNFTFLLVINGLLF